MHTLPRFLTRSSQRPPAWTFLTNHAHVLLCIMQNPEALLRDLALQVGITERAVQRIIAELAADGYLRSERSGRRNRYQIKADASLRHPLESHCSVAALLRLLSHRGNRRASAVPPLPTKVEGGPTDEGAARTHSRSAVPRRCAVLKSASDRWPDEGVVFE